MLKQDTIDYMKMTIKKIIDPKIVEINPQILNSILQKNIEDLTGLENEEDMDYVDFINSIFGENKEEENKFSALIKHFNEILLILIQNVGYRKITDGLYIIEFKTFSIEELLILSQVLVKEPILTAAQSNIVLELEGGIIDLGMNLLYTKEQLIKGC